MNTVTRNLRIGLPSKGRLSELANELLNQAGIRFRRQNRSLSASVSGLPIDLKFLRTDDIPILCSEGAIDAGITGSDLVQESGASVKTTMPLGVGKCRLAICVPEAMKINSAADMRGMRIATSFPNVTRQHLQKNGIDDPYIIQLTGSVEVMIQLGVADAIVDLVETGSTLAANQLRILEEIGSYETVLVQNEKLTDQETLQRVVRRLEGVVIARDYAMLEYNIPLDQLDQAKMITPGFNSPTVQTLENASMRSV
ncbi:MAG: ATP phosphoribosyltransferase, partial [Planctomycetota bacterium]